MPFLLPARARGRALVTGGLLASLTACGAGAVEVPVPRPGPVAAGLCRALHDRLPRELHGLSRRSTTVTSPTVMAWGSPAIVVRCGVPRPAQLHPTSDLEVVNGVSWLPVPTDRPVTFTAVGRRAYVEVTVPAKYAPAGDVLIELTGPITATIPANPDGSL